MNATQHRPVRPPCMYLLVAHERSMIHPCALTGNPAGEKPQGTAVETKALALQGHFFVQLTEMVKPTPNKVPPPGTETTQEKQLQFQKSPSAPGPKETSPSGGNLHPIVNGLKYSLRADIPPIHHSSLQI